MGPTEDPQVFEIGEFRVDMVQRALIAGDGSRIALSSRAFDLLAYFVRHPGELLDKDRLMKAVWPHTVVEENNLNQSIGAIRKVLGESPADRKFLVTDPGRGYRFVAPVRPLFAESVPPTAAAPVTPRNAAFAAMRMLAIVALVLAMVAAIVLMARTRPAPALDRSIAVLPFENRSAAPENGFLALGIQEEVLTLLTRIGDLRVVPRASTARFAGSAATAGEIGRELGVDYLLEGSVQRSGDRLRVNVALIDAGRNRHLWASSYERSAAEVFAVESEVARDVATALQARLTATERNAISQPPTAVPAAYDSYLRAKAFAERTTRTEAEIQGALAAYDEAVRLDPHFAFAWAQLSRRNANLYSLGYDRSVDRRDAARRSLERALELRPDLVEVQVARGYFEFVVDGDLERAEGAFRALEAQHPDSADVTAGLAQILQELGQRDRSDDYARRTLALDPQNPYRHALICQDFVTAREFDAATKTCARALQLLPGDVGILTLLATIHQARGDLEQSRDLLRALAPAPGDWRTLRAMSRQLLLDHSPRAAAELLSSYLVNAQALGSRRGSVRRWLGDAQRLAGDSASARDSYDIARTELEQELSRQRENSLLVADLAIVQARLGNRSAAIGLARTCANLAARARRHSFVAECVLASIQVELATGVPADVFARLKEALTLPGELPPLTPALLRIDPDYDAVRNVAGFKVLL